MPHLARLDWSRNISGSFEIATDVSSSQAAHPNNRDCVGVSKNVPPQSIGTGGGALPETEMALASLGSTTKTSSAAAISRMATTNSFDLHRESDPFIVYQDAYA
jgi:hypothetical protein